MTTMKIKNIEPGLRKTMVAVFMKRGMPLEAAVAKAEKNLGGALSKFNESQAKSAATKPVRSDLGNTRLKAASAAARAKGKAKADGAAKANSRKLPPSIKTSSKKITSAEQVALHKVKAASNTTAFLAAKTSASVAIALGAVATWAKTL